MVVLPTDAAKYGVNPDDLDVSLAVRMSMSIPFFFYPVQQWGSYFVDGGLLSNYPLELFDSGGPPLYPTIGFLMYEPGTPRDALSLPNKITGPFSAFEAMLKTAANARDTWYMDQDKLARTVRMDSLGIQATDFQITRTQSEALFNAGVAAAQTVPRGKGTRWSGRDTAVYPCARRSAACQRLSSGSSSDGDGSGAWQNARASRLAQR